MNALSRFSDIVNANLNAIMERVEDPETMIRHAVTQMRETLVDVRATTARYIADKKRLDARCAAVTRAAEAWEEKAERAISHGRDDLARQAIRERQQCETEAEAITAESAGLTEAIARLQQDSVSLEEKLKEARARQAALVIRGKTAQSRVRARRQIHDVDIEPAFARFEDYARRIDELEGEAEAYEIGTTNLSAEIARLDQDDHVNQELAALKARIQVNNRVTG